jgi:hypothetical protein
MPDTRLEDSAHNETSGEAVMRDAHAAMLDDIRTSERSSYKSAMSMTLFAGLIDPLFAPDAAPANAKFAERVSTNFIEASKKGLSNIARGSMTVTGGAIGNTAVDVAIAKVTGNNEYVESSRTMKNFDTIALATAGIAAIRFPVLKTIGVATAAHTIARIYEKW